jgi:hypothetical protein
MNMMCRAMQRRWTGRASRKAEALVRYCVVFLLLLQSVYIPIHLYRVPHSEEAEYSAPAPLAAPTCLAEQDDHDVDGHHARHPAAQHKFKVTQPARGVAPEMVLVQTVSWLEAGTDRPHPEAVDFSGLSPPEFSCSWQFIFRAALPVRAPPLLS